MNCCKGYTSKCIECGFKGCSSCRVPVHTEKGSYCFDCSNKIDNKTKLFKAKERIKYLKTLLKINKIKYEHSDESYSSEEINNKDECKTQ